MHFCFSLIDAHSQGASCGAAYIAWRATWRTGCAAAHVLLLPPALLPRCNPSYGAVICDLLQKTNAEHVASEAVHKQGAPLGKMKKQQIVPSSVPTAAQLGATPFIGAFTR